MAEAARKGHHGLWSKLRFAALGLGLALAACAGGSRVIPEAGRAPVTEAPPPVAAQPLPIAPGLPQDVARHRVALLVPTSGPNAGIGNSLNNATQLALLDTNATSLRITTYDTAGPGGAVAAANQAIADGNRMILGPLLAEDVAAVAPIARRAHVPVIGFSNDASVAGNGVYLLGYEPSQSIARVVAYAREQGVTRFAGLVPEGLYGDRASDALRTAVAASGGELVDIQSYGRVQGSLTSAIVRLGRKPYQAILIATSSGNAAQAAPLIRRNGGTAARLLGTEFWNSDSDVGTQKALEGAWFASVADDRYRRRFAGEYRTRFGVAPYRLATMGYDAVLLALRVAREWRPGDSFPEALLRKSGGFDGLDGVFRFGSGGVAERALEVQEIRAGDTVTISPAPTKLDD